MYKGRRVFLKRGGLFLKRGGVLIQTSRRFFKMPRGYCLFLISVDAFFLH